MMQTSFAQLNDLLDRINRYREGYEARLRNLSGTELIIEDGNGSRKPEWAQLEEDVSHHFKALARDEHNLHREVAMQIIRITDESVNSYGSLRPGSNNLQRLKRHIVKYQIETVLELLSSYLGPDGHFNRNRSRVEGFELEQPYKLRDEVEQEKVHLFEEFEDFLKRVDPDLIPKYYERVKEAVAETGDGELGEMMLDTLRDNLLYWCLTPSITFQKVERSSEEDGPPDPKHNYLHLLLQLEEMQTRLAVVRRNWRFKHDYRQRLDNFRKDIEHVRSRIIRSDTFIDDVYDGNVIVSNILKQTAFTGPMQLEMAQKYVDILSSEIWNKIFGESWSVEDYRFPTRVVGIKKPRKYLECDRLKLRGQGVPEKELQKLDPYVYCIAETHTLMDLPPERYPEDRPLPVGVNPSGGQVYKAMRYKVLYFFSGANAEDNELRDLYNAGLRPGNPSFVAALENAKLPKDNYQILIPTLILFREKDMSDGVPFQGKVEVFPPGSDSGIEKQLAEMLETDPYSVILTEDQFDRKYV
jgi:hypothetical protein